MSIYFSGVTNRRRTALKKLQEQLKSGKKLLKDGKTTEPLTEFDVKRIEKEIAILKGRI